jgi:hypothetical protein
MRRWNDNNDNVRWVPCHHGMARPQVADGDGLQIWTVAENIFNKQSRTADGGGPPAWGLDVGLTTPTVKNEFVTKRHKRPRTWTDSLDKQPKIKKMGIWIGSIWLRIGTNGGLL